MQLSYDAHFAHAVATGAKCCTIRRRAARPGETLHHFAGPYRPGLRRRLATTVCTCVERITISPRTVTLSGRRLTAAEVHALALRDGFPDTATFRRYFAPFRGYLITWTHECPPLPT